MPRRGKSRGGVRVERFSTEAGSLGRSEPAEVAVKVTLGEGASWVGVFESGGYDSPPSVGFELFEWPDGKSFCVIVGGAGYVVRADKPGIERRIRGFPIIGVQPVPELGLVVFIDFVTAVAYDATRMAWESPRLSYDLLEIVGLSGTRLRLQGWNAPERRMDGITLDLTTGTSPDSFYPADAPWLGDLNLRRP